MKKKKRFFKFRGPLRNVFVCSLLTRRQENFAMTSLIAVACLLVGFIAGILMGCRIGHDAEEVPRSEDNREATINSVCDSRLYN